MKKVISVLLLACMLLTLTACGSQPAAPATDPTAEATEAPAAETAEAEYKLGMGVSVSLDSSDTNKAQVAATVATVVTDSEGKIVLCRIDCAQNKMDVTGGQVDTAATYTTKRDLKYDYNMVKYSDATLEWFEQVVRFLLHQPRGLPGGHCEGLQRREGLHLHRRPRLLHAGRVRHLQLHRVRVRC